VSHGSLTITCHCGQTLAVRDVWQHLAHNHAPPDEPAKPFDYSTLELEPPEDDRKEEQ
jgi:hypothetical protein